VLCFRRTKRERNRERDSLSFDRLFLLLELLSAILNVGMIKEVAEESDVTDLHEKTIPEDGPGGVHRLTGRLQITHVEENGVSDGELSDLHCRDVSRDPRGASDFARGQEIIRIHDCVDAEVEPNNPRVIAGSVVVGPNAVVERRHVVIPMEEHQWSFAENDEDGVTKLGHLGHAEPEGPQTAEAFEEVTAFRVRRDETVRGDFVIESGGSDESAADAEQCQPEVPQLERDSDFDGFPIGHEGFDAENDDHIGHGEPEGGPLDGFGVVDAFGVSERLLEGDLEKAGHSEVRRTTQSSVGRERRCF